MTYANESRPARGGSRNAVCRRGSDSNEFYHNPRPLQGPRFEPAFRRQVERVCRFGPFAMACLLEEIAAGKDLRETVAIYAALDGGIIATLDGASFPPSLRAIDGGGA